MRNRTHEHGTHVLALAALATASLALGACEREPGLEEQELGTAYEPEDATPLAPGTPQDAGAPRTQLQEPPVTGAPRAGATEELGAGEVEVAIRAARDGEVRVGETLEYAIVVHNASDDAVHALTVNHYLPPSFEFIESTPPRQRQGARTGPMDARPVEAGFEREGRTGEEPAPAGQEPSSEASRMEAESGTQRAQQMSWRIPRLDPGATEEIVVRGIAAEAGPIEACVTLAYDPALCARFQAVEPELVLERAFAIEGDEVYVCDEIPIVYRVRNTGTGESEAITVEEELPEGLVTLAGERTVSLRMDPLAPGASAEEEVVTRAQRGGELSGRAVATTAALEVRSGRSSIRVLEPSLALRVDAPQQQYLGRVVTFGVELENTSDVPVIDTVVRWTRPEGIVRFGISSGAVEAREDGFFVGTLAPGEVRRFELSFEGTRPQTLEATLAAEAYCVAPMEETVSTELVGIEAVRLEAIDLSDPVAVGELTTYEIRVKNQGTAAGLGIEVSAALPAGLEFVSAEGDSAVEDRDGTLRFGRLDELAPGDIATWRIAARASEPGKVRFEVELKTEATPEAVREVEPTTLY